jgi:hypothetical protein
MLKRFLGVEGGILIKAKWAKKYFHQTSAYLSIIIYCFIFVWFSLGERVPMFKTVNNGIN